MISKNLHRVTGIGREGGRGRKSDCEIVTFTISKFHFSAGLDKRRERGSYDRERRDRERVGTV